MKLSRLYIRSKKLIWELPILQMWSSFEILIKHGKKPSICHLFVPSTQPWTNLQDTHLQNCWCVCIIFKPSNDPHLMRFCWFFYTQHQSISSGKNLLLTDLFFGVKSESLTTNMAIFRKINTLIILYGK